MKVRLCATFLALALTPAWAHRLDEYLQGTILSVGRNQLQAQMTMTPGVAIFPILIADIDTDGNGAVSETERAAYAARVLQDLSLKIDGRVLTPRLTSIRFPEVEEMKQGRGEIHLDFIAELPQGGRERELILENRHQRRISAYQVNSLISRDPDIRIAEQRRNYTQSFYRLDYERMDVHPDWAASARYGQMLWLSPIAFLLMTRLTLRWRTNLIERSPAASSEQ